MTPTPRTGRLPRTSRGLCCAPPSASARDHALVAQALDTGLREGEIARLDDADVSITARAGHVRVAAGKVGKLRQVPLKALTRSVITAWRERRAEASRGLGDPVLFVGRDGQRLSARSVGRVVREAGRAAGLEISPATPAPPTWYAPAAAR